MENRDFRDRLKNHTREPNPVAWDQMESLLNSLPEAKDKKKKKRRGFWLFFFGLGILGIVMFALILKGGLLHNQSNETFSMTEEQSMGNSKDSKSKTPFSQNNNAENSELANQESNDEAAEETESKLDTDSRVNQSESSSEDNILNEDSETDNINIPSEKFENSVSESIENTTIQASKQDSISKVGSEAAETEDGVTLENSTNNTNEENIQNPIINSDDDSKEKSLTNQNSIEKDVDDIMMNDIPDVEENSIKSIEEEATKEEPATEERTAFLPLDRLIIPVKEITTFDKESIDLSSEIIVEKPKYFDAFVGGGYASFNDNPGFIIHTGICYDVDRILSLETNLGYTYGSAQNIPSGEPFTFEKQFDISLLIHLNVIKNHNHRFSFFAGTGRTFYSGERVINLNPININVRSSRGRNFQVGFDYRIRIKKYNSLGFRIGAIAYDDSIVYASTRFVQEF